MWCPSNICIPKRYNNIWVYIKEMNFTLFYVSTCICFVVVVICVAIVIYNKQTTLASEIQILISQNGQFKG